MAHLNPNTLSNFSQSWQRAIHFRQFETDSNFVDAESSCCEKEALRYEHEYLESSRPCGSVSRTQSSYGTITVSADTALASTYLSKYVGKEQVVGNTELSGSTVWMTIFNCTNMLVGVGTLSLALAFRQTGWILGLILLTLPVLVTMYTARLLVRCLDANADAFTYGDIACLAYGSIGQHLCEVLFASELIAANAALFILFADSLSALLPGVNTQLCKIVVAFAMVPLNFAPFRILSITSAIGIFCFLGIITVLVTSGLVKPDAPGSLHEFATTSLGPRSWTALATSIGMFMAPWGAHSVVPAIYRDMRHPAKYPKALRFTYSICFIIAFSVAVLGYAMFGDDVLPEITSSILSVAQYPAAISAFTLILVTTIPLTKVSLNNRPVIDTINRRFRIHPQQIDAMYAGETAVQLARAAVGLGINMLELLLALAIPDFGNLVALLGSALCITISVVLPACFFMKIAKAHRLEASAWDQGTCWALIVVGISCAVSGTIVMFS